MGFAHDVIDFGQEFRALNVYSEGKKLSRIDFRKVDWQDAIYPYWLSIPQSETERFLEEHLARLGVEVERHTKLTDLVQEEGRVYATLTRTNEAGQEMSSEVVESAWLVGCDGARSTTRKLCQIAYEGTAEDELFVLGDVSIEWDEPEDEGQNFMSSDGILLIVPLPKAQHYRIIAHMPSLSSKQMPEITLDLLQSLVDERTKMAISVNDLVWSSSFTVKHLVAAHHRQGRIFLAGDAAHIHSPVGGQGLNTGLQDAYNLMWKLALVHHGKGSEKLLDSYEAERHEVAEATIKKVSFVTSLVTTKKPISRTLRNQLAAILINTDAVQNRFGRDVGMLDISYRNSPVVQEHTIRLTPMQHVRKVLGRNASTFDEGPSCGDRAPNVFFLDEKNTSRSLVDYLYGTRHKLLLFAGLQDQAPSRTLQQVKTWVEEQYPDRIESYLVTTATPSASEWDGAMIVDQNGAIHRRYGASEEAIYLCRPDHHIAYRSQPVELDLFAAYLEQILAVPQNSHRTIFGHKNLTAN